MQCCVPFCNSSENASYKQRSDGQRTTFHRFPSDPHLRAAWLQALGMQGTPLSDPAVVCSQHFLNDDLYETENGLMQIRADSIPTTVQVCMICLDSDSKLFLLSKHKLEEAYKYLTGNPPCDVGNLKQALCVHCAQRLRNFSRFRDKSLRARELMMGLVQQHDLITKQHIKIVNRTTHKLSNNMVSKTLEPDHCDLYIVEDKQAESEPTLSVVVKTETNYEPMSEDEEVTQYQGYNVKVELDPLKYETTHIQCKICFEEFDHEHTYKQHVTVHAENGAGASKCGASRSKSRTENEPTQQPSDDPHELSDDPHELSDDPGSSGLLPHMSVAPMYVGLAPNETNTARVTEEVSTIEKSEKILEIYFDNHTAPEQQSFTCKICPNMFKSKPDLDNHVKRHIVEKLYACQFCEYKSHNKSYSIMHMRTHTGDKRFCCALCEYKSVQKSSLVTHMRTHTGEKPFSCTLCDYKCADKRYLDRHMKTHTGEKPFTCKLCEHKFAKNYYLVTHMRTHTGEKPFSCTLCEYKCAAKRNLSRHMRTHTGEKPFSCKLCDYKCSFNNILLKHMRTHTGEKPYSCTVCEFICAAKSNLTSHMRTHTGDKSQGKV